MKGVDAHVLALIFWPKTTSLWLTQGHPLRGVLSKHSSTPPAGTCRPASSMRRNLPLLPPWPAASARSCPGLDGRLLQVGANFPQQRRKQSSHHPAIIRGLAAEASKAKERYRDMCFARLAQNSFIHSGTVLDCSCRCDRLREVRYASHILTESLQFAPDSKP